jgi:pimeloyl-ACP methyl ester carboxylesterase
VRDLDLLRRLVGDGDLNYYGESYGTAIGSLYATMFPDKVGRMVLDGAYNLDDHPIRGTTYAFERQLNAVVDFCVKGPSCPLGDDRDEALRQIADLLQSLDKAAMRAGGRQLTQPAAVRAVRFGLYEEFGWPRLTHALGTAIKDRDGTALLALDENFTGRDSDGTFPQWVSAYFAVTCLDYHDQGIDNRIADAAEETTTSPVLGRHLGLDLSCPLWPVQAHGHPRIGADTQPILVVSTTGDPATPYESAVRLSERLTNSVLLTLEGHGHLAYRQSNCIQRHVVDFLTQGIKPPAGTSCDI